MHLYNGEWIEVCHRCPLDDLPNMKQADLFLLASAIFRGELVVDPVNACYMNAQLESKPNLCVLRL